jgi:hypothetical protein
MNMGKKELKKNAPTEEKKNQNKIAQFNEQ